MRMSTLTAILLISLSLTPVSSLAQSSPSSEPPADAKDLMTRMSEIVDFLDSRSYASSVSWPEHIVLCHQLAQGVDPTLVEFAVINGSVCELASARRAVLAIAIAGDEEKPTWDQVREFLGKRSVLDFQSSPGTRKSAEMLASASKKEILEALEEEEKKKISEQGPFPEPKAPPVQEALPGTAYNTYFGFLHAHSNLSDGSGSADEAYSYARDVAGLDFFALTDHGECMAVAWPWDPDPYDTLLRAADAHDAPGSFAALYGFEWTSWGLYGHINVINVRSYTSVFSRPTLSSIYRWIGDRPYSIATFNHPGREDDLDSEFRHFGYESYPAYNMVGLEVWNKGHGFAEQFYTCSWDTCQAPTFMDEGIRKGWRLGPLGGGDNHDRQWGTDHDFRVAVLSTQLTRNDIVNAYFDRRFYATEDKNLLLDVRVQGHPMGSRLTNLIREFRVEANDSAGDPFAQVRFYRDGHVIDSREVSGNSVAVTFNDPNSSGSNYYYIVVRQADGEEAVSSPIYISGPPPLTPPVACFTNSCNGFSCNFDATCTTGGNGSLSYAWNFGDGSSATGANVSHTFASTNTYNVQLTVTDPLNQTDTTSRPVSVSCGDTIRPTVSLTAPGNLQYIWGNATFSANASDNVGVDKVQFLLGNQVICTDHNPPWSCQGNVDIYPTGPYTVKAVAFDDCGNDGTSAARTVRVVSNPEMAVDQPIANATVSGVAVGISGWATDPNRVTSLTITLDGWVTIPVTYGTPRSSVCQSVPVNDPNCPNVGFSATFNSTLYENGPHRIDVVATDATGKPTSRTVHFTIANAPPVTCTPGPYTLCLRGNRFKVEATYVNNGSGQPARATTYSDQSGFFWFFGSANLEVGVKVLGPANGYWWVFHGAGTDREYTLAVTDTVTGDVQSYVKPGGSFCGDADTQAFPASAPGFLADEYDEKESESSANQTAAGVCTPSSTRLCLLNDRFQVEVLRNAVAQPAIELTPETGTVWFFNSENAEVFVKVLDGRGVNGHYWVFYGSLTDRSFTVRVVDTLTGQVVTYDNAQGNSVCGHGDTSAFP